MEVIELPGYTQEEKLQIALTYLVRRQRDLCGLREAGCEEFECEQAVARFAALQL